MEENKEAGTVGDEFMVWAVKHYNMDKSYDDIELLTMRDKINDIIHSRIIELIQEQRTNR